MADAFTGTTELADQVIAAYDRNAFFALRAGAVYDQFARVKPGNVTSPGSSVSFLFWSDLSAATATLSETVDVDAVALADSLVTLTPQEHGNAVLVTLRVQTDTFALGFDPNVANLVAYNMLDSLETLAQEAIEAGATTTTVDAGNETDLTAGDIMTLNRIRQEVAVMKGANVAPIDGANYALIIHPDTEYDLMTATAATDWSAWAVRNGTDEFKNGEVGRIAGVRIFSTSRGAINTDGGSSNVDVYSNYFLGAEGFGKAVSIPPHIVPGPITDKLRRFMPLGWHTYLDYGVIRSAALRNVLAASSIGTN